MGVCNRLSDLMLWHGISHSHHRIVTTGSFFSFSEKVLMIKSWSISGSSRHYTIHDAIFRSAGNGILVAELTFRQNSHGSGSFELLKIRLVLSTFFSDSRLHTIVVSHFGVMNSAKRTAHQTTDSPFCFCKG